MAAGRSRIGPEVDEPVGRLHEVEVVLDDQQGVACLDQRLERSNQFGNVIEVQARGGLIEEEQHALLRFGTALGGICQVACNLQALGLPAREGRHGLAKPKVVEAHIHQGLQPSLHLTVVCKEGQGLRDRHLEDVCDRLASHHDLERLCTKTFALAVGALEVDIREELHLHLLKATAIAGRAAAGAGIEAEGAHRVAALKGQRCLCELPTNGIEGTHIDGGVRSCGLANRGLVDHEDIRDEACSLEGLIGARRVGGLAEVFA